MFHIKKKNLAFGSAPEVFAFQIYFSLLKNAPLVSVVNHHRYLPYLSSVFCPIEGLENLVNTSKISLVFDVKTEDLALISSKKYIKKTHLYDCCRPESNCFQMVVKSKLRREISRRTRKLQEIGNLKTQIFNGPQIDRSASNDLHILLKKNQDERGIPTRWASPHNIEALHNCCRAEGSLIFRLSLENDTIAIAQCQIVNNVCIYMIPSFDPSYSKFSPSMILLQEIFDYCFENKLDVDFGKGAEGYKTHFKIEKYPLFMVTASNTWMSYAAANVLHALMAAMIRLKRRNKKEARN